MLILKIFPVPLETPNELGASCFVFAKSCSPGEGSDDEPMDASQGQLTLPIPSRSGAGKRHVVSVKGFYAQHQ